MRAHRLLPLASLLSIGCLDHRPPTLSLSAPETDRVYRQALEISGEASDPSGLASLSLSVDGGEPIALPTDGAFQHTLDTSTLPDGVHLVEVVATDDTSLANTTRGSVAFASDNTPPELRIAERSLKTAQGEVLAVFVSATEVLVEPKLTFLEREIPLYPLSSTLYRSLIGISVKQEAGTFPLVLAATDALGNTGERTMEVEIAATDFEKGGYIKLTKKQQENQKDDSKVTYDRTKREAAWAHVDPQQHWGGPFLRPAEGSISSPFGKYREYSSGVRSHHLGLDLSNEPGTPIYAANDGVVLLAERLYIMGNHVIVHHGQGVASAYSHLSSVAVSAGDRVQKGQLIGTMGSTGQSTGPHLHWEVVVHGEKIHPLEWEEESFEPPDDLVFR